MPLITETYYLSLTQDNRGILRLRCSQDDTLRTVNLKLYNNGSIFVIPSGISASISGVKQNGAVFSKPCTISQNRESVVLQLSSDITNVDGIIVAEIVLNDGEGGRLGTSNFIIQVEKNPIRAGVVQDTETPIEYINDFIEKIQTLTARLNNLITPSGDASLAEVVDARMGILDSTTYQTLGARLNAEFQRLSNALSGITILESTSDTTDRTSEILSKLNAYGICKLGKGDFYVNRLVMPEDSQLIGSGKSTRIILQSSVTDGYVVKPKSNCIIENVSFYGGFTGTHSELIASAATATRHCIILDRFNSVSSENVILNNIFINNFVGSAIIQRYATGCHCEDIIINMCYVGIDISNASYDGQCTNVSMTNTRYGVVQNGSNFVFTNCVSKDSDQHIMSDQQNTECTFSSCTFFDSSLETTSRLATLSNVRNGFVFDNCIFDSSLRMLLNACDGIVIKGTNFVGSDTFRITVSNGRNTLLLITDCIADVEPVVTNAGTAARITSCYLKDGTAWSISEAHDGSGGSSTLAELTDTDISSEQDGQVLIYDGTSNKWVNRTPSDGSVEIEVDNELSSTSENPVQNKVINREISEIKADLADNEEIASDVSRGLVLYKSDNLFNMSSASDGYVTADGVFHSGSSYFVSDFIEVSENDVITFYAFTHTYTSNARTAIGARFLCAYDANKNPVAASGSGSTVSSYTVPSGIKYIRCSLAIAYKTKKPYIAKNAVPTAYTSGFEDKLVHYGQAGNHAYIYNCDSSFYNETFELPTMSLCKNVIYSFTGFVSSFTLSSFKLSIGHGSDHFGSTWIEIDKDNVYWHIYTSTDAVYTFPHELPFDTVATGFISISIITNDNTKATLKINYGETEYTKTLGFYGFSDQAFFVTSYVITIKNAVFSVTCKDFDAPVFAFGDSYTAIIESTSKWTHYLVADGFGDKICLNAFPGADSAELASAFANTLKVATPQKILWCLGMNDGSDTDASTPNQQWLSNVTNMLNVCRQKNIEPIFLTIPTVPSVYNEGKNTWIRTSQYRFADVALALGADGTGAWGSGMLSTDKVHPTPYGAKTIYSKIMSDLPDIFV